MTCDRCRKETRSSSMSYFNTDVICPDCDAEERAHPDYERAREIELEHVRNGDYNFRGVGLPHDLVRR